VSARHFSANETNLADVNVPAVRTARAVIPPVGNTLLA
jgi:hypothetical protein